MTLAAIGLAGLGGAALAGPQEPPRLDPVFFEERVLPIVRARCASPACHGSAEGAGGLRLDQAGFGGEFTEEQARENCRAAMAFVRPGRPEESLFLRKALREEEGGLPHGGGSYDFARGSEEHAALEAWIRGERTPGIAPIVGVAPVEARVALGSGVRLDATASRDRRDAPLAFRWSVAAAPEGSRAAIEEAEAAVARIEPDVAGAYSVAVRVSNGESEAEAAIAFSAEVLPYYRVEGEAGDLTLPFETVPDPDTSGGAFLVAEAEGRAKYPFSVAEAGEYRLWVRARPLGAGGTLAFSVDGAAPIRWTAPSTEGWSHAAVAGSGTRGRRDVAGRWTQEEGALVVEPAGRGRGAALTLFEAKVPEGTVEVTVVPPAATEGEASAGGGAFVYLGAPEGFRGLVAGLAEGGSRWVIGMAGRGRFESFEEAGGPGGGAGGVRFGVSFDARRVRILHEGRRVLECEVPPALLGGPGRGGMGGRGGRGGRAPVAFAVGLLASGAARFDDLAVRRRGEVVLEEAFEGRRGGIRLRAGPHALEIEGEEGAVAIDHLLLARAGAAADLTDEARREVRALHLDLLRRTPTEIELLTAGGDRAALARRLAGSLEFWQAWYEEELYYLLLIDNFRPATPALERLPARLAGGSIDVLDAVREIVISQSFNLRNPGPDTFVSVVLEQGLGLRVQSEPEALEAGKRMYDGHEAVLFGRSGRSQADLVEIVMSHEAFAPRYLGRFHEAIFGAPAADGGRDAARFREDPGAFPAILAEWLARPEYEAALGSRRAKTERMFIQGLFVDLLGRAPTYREYRNMRNALQALSDPRPIRSVLARVLAGSRQVAFPRKEAIEPETWIGEQFRRFLGRSPTDPELAAYLEAWRDEACTPALVVSSLLTSHEYQTY